MVVREIGGQLALMTANELLTEADETVKPEACRFQKPSRETHWLL